MMNAAAAATHTVGWMDNLPAIFMIVIFLVMTGLMYSRKISALLALPIMALAFAIVGLVRIQDFHAILVDATDGATAWQLIVSAAGWVAIAVWTLWASRRGRITSLATWVVPVVTLFIALLLNMSSIGMLSAKGVWGSLLNCFETKTILDEVLHKGALRLHEAYTVAFFGGMLAIYVKEKRLAETLIKYAAELAGDRPMVVALVMMLVTFLLFTTLGGLGAIIMVGSIILPIMLSLGLSPAVAAGIFLIGICAGGTFNPIGWALYRETLNVPVESIQRFAVMMVLLYIVTGTVFVGLSMRGRRRSRRWTLAAAGGPSSTLQVRPLALLSPIIPIILVFKMSIFAQLFDYLIPPAYFQMAQWVVFGGVGLALTAWGLRSRWNSSPNRAGSPVWLILGIVLLLIHGAFWLGPSHLLLSAHDYVLRGLDGFRAFAGFWDTYIGGWSFIPAFLAGLVFCLVTTWDAKGNNVRVLTKSAIEGSESVMPAVLLMCGIGMLLQVVRNEQVAGYLSPLIAAVTPSGKVGYVVGFGLAAPLALYRGPLNIWGLGLGIAAVMSSTGRLSGELLTGMFMAVGAVQGVCDPTNTHNVWIANFLGEDVLAITRFLLPYIWAMVFVGLLIAALLF
jgi:hypothetical protein